MFSSSCSNDFIIWLTVDYDGTGFSARLGISESGYGYIEFFLVSVVSGCDCHVLYINTVDIRHL